MPFLNSEGKLKSSSSSSHSHRGEVVLPKLNHEAYATVFRAFNSHARECGRCAKPLEVVNRGEMLCEKGHQIAGDIAKILYKIAEQKAEEHRITSSSLGILVDLTEFGGPVVDLVRCIERGLRDRKPSTVQPAVFSASVRPGPISRRSTYYEGGNSSSTPTSRHHYHHHYNYHHEAPSTPAPRYEDRPIVHHRNESERSPRSSGSLRVHAPQPRPTLIEYGTYSEEAHHPNGGRVTTKYYYPQTPRRSNSTGPEGNVRTVSTGKSGSKVRFNEEVKYYT